MKIIYSNSLPAILFGMLVLAFATNMYSQTLTNNGALIYVNKKATMRVCGVMNNNQNGIVTVQDSSLLRVDGTMNVNSGTVTYNATSIGIVSMNMTIAGTPCGPISGTVIRNGNGTLTITGDLVNNGQLTNNSFIYCGNWFNNGTCDNNTNAVLEVR